MYNKSPQENRVIPGGDFDFNYKLNLLKNYEISYYPR